MNSSKIEVSVIIVNYNTRDLLRNCILSLKKNTSGVSYEIIVVDNDSSDDSDIMISKEFPEVIFVKSGGNLGFGRANNIGMYKAKGEYLFLLNSDTLVRNNALRIFLDFARNCGSDFGAAGCILKGPDDAPCHSYGPFIVPSSELRNIAGKFLRFLKDSSHLHPNEVDAPIEVEYITGADIFLPKRVFEITEGFDPDFFLYCEEVDWQKRMADLGLKRYIIPGPDIVHLEGGSDASKSSIWSPTRLHNFDVSHKIYYRKHFKPIAYQLLWPMYTVSQRLIYTLLFLVKDRKYGKLIFCSTDKSG